MTELVSYRTEFDSIQSCHYLISNSLGAMPNRATALTKEYNEIWSNRGVRAWDEAWWNLPREIGNKIAAVVGASEDTITMQPNVTSAQATILSCFDIKPERNKIVMVDGEFPSLKYLYTRWTEGEAEVQFVVSDDGISVPMQKLLDAIDETTLLVPISHVLFRSSTIVDAAAIIEKAHSVGAKVVLDIYQSIGAVPVDLGALGVDFAVGGLLKWMCGGPGACFLYVRPDLAKELTPRFTGWLAHENPFGFEAPPMRYSEGSYKFLNGTPAIPSLYSCQAGLEIITEVGVEKIRKRSIDLTTHLMKAAAERDWPTFAPKDSSERGGTVALNLPDAENIAKRLSAYDYLVDFRPGAGIRVSPHFYNKFQELDDLVEQIEYIISRNWD